MVRDSVYSVAQFVTYIRAVLRHVFMELRCSAVGQEEADRERTSA
jgi:hypothetical protein